VAGTVDQSFDLCCLGTEAATNLYDSWPLEIIGSHQKSSRHIQWRAATKDQEWAASQMELSDEKMHGVRMKLFIHSASPQRTNDAHQPVNPTFGEAISIRISHHIHRQASRSWHGIGMRSVSNYY
jgi:hypothetical protein